MSLKIFDVRIQATVTKTLRINAETEKEAIELAHEVFTVAPEEGEPEKYDEECLSCVEVPIDPPLDCSNEVLVAYIRSMKGGERVIEMGGSAMKGETGTVEINPVGGICIRWDTEFKEGSGMVTSFTGGARIIEPREE
jgi:hypothetical protein